MVIEEKDKEVELKRKASKETTANVKKSTCMMVPVLGGGFASRSGYQRPRSKINNLTKTEKKKEKMVYVLNI